MKNALSALSIKEKTAALPSVQTETAFDVFSVTDDAVYMTRFGAGTDRQVAIIKRHPKY